MARRKPRVQLDAAQVREQLAICQSQLATLNEQRAALTQLIRGYEKWLALYDPANAAPPAAGQPGETIKEG